ncbi:MAG: phosphate ABC transporter permease subunit PstC [Propionibacteriaceae bacterium]|nr:phosphate ABC transporter permease subunit PstC [Propionibacteriaceae bacterium]
MDTAVMAPLPRRERVADVSAKTIVIAASAVVGLALGGVAVFLGIQGAPAWLADSTQLPLNASSIWSLALPLAFGSVWAACLGLLIAVPLAIGVALFITWYAPKRVAGLLAAVIDLLAAVPSVVYGLWGLMVVAPIMARAYSWLGTHLGWIPLFAGRPSASGRTIFTAAVILAIMVMPIIAAICREVFLQVPSTSTEAAVGLGATKWETIRLAVFPFARSGIVSGAMLGLGRALGETMATAMIISPTPFLISVSLTTSSNPNTIAAFIAQNFPEAHGVQVSALVGLGLVLFAITFVVNALARRIASGNGGSK